VTAAEKKFAFQHAGADRAEHLRENAELLDQYWLTAKLLVIDAHGNARFLNFDPLANTSTQFEFISAAQLFPQRTKQASLLGLVKDTAWFAICADQLAEMPLHSLDGRTIAATWLPEQASLYAQARALLYWQQRNRFCGACGKALTLERAGFMLKCAACAVEHYPRTDSAIIVAVSDGEKLLLGRQAAWPANRWSVLAGFLEPGESLEHTVRREVFEEAGVRVNEVHYATSQMWPFPASLMLGFHAHAKPQPAVVGDELEAAAWFSAADIYARVASGDLVLPPSLSISRWLIEDWCQKQGVCLDHLAQAAFIR
jgi:NAD+ diphosphatase